MRIAQFWATVAEEHNVPKFAQILHDDFIMWYNFDPTERNKEQFMETLRSAHASFTDQTNEDTRITLTTDGFVLQATMKGLMEGRPISAPYCIVAKIKDGKVIRGDEYFDTSQLTKYAGPVGEGMVKA